MILFCEVNKTGEEHVIINNCLLKLVRISAPQEAINVWIDPKHYNNFPEKIPDVKIIARHVLEPKKSNKVRWVYKLISEAYLITCIFLSARKLKSSLIFFSSLSPFGIFLTTIIKTLIYPSAKVIITLHSDIEVLKSGNRKKAVENLYAKFLRHTFNRKYSWLKFLVLSEVIAENLIKDLVLQREQIIVIEHPYIFPAIEEHEVSQFKKPIVFGHLGVAKLAKQSPLFFRLASTLKKEIQEGKVQFVVAGQVLDEMYPYVNEYVIFNNQKDFISRHEYEKILTKVDYAVFLYDDKSYEYTSSGAVLDALAFELPILALNISLFKHLFDQTHTAGISYNSFDELVDGIKRIIEKHADNYKTLKSGVQILKNKYTVEAQLKSFKTQLDNFLTYD